MIIKLTRSKAINQFLKLANHVSTGMRFKKVHYLRVSKNFQFQRIINAEILTKMAKDLGAMSRKDQSSTLMVQYMKENGPSL